MPPPTEDRMESWVDGVSIQIIAISASGDPMDCSTEEARAFAEMILKQCDEIDSTGE
jgi:hypothetical protein